MSAACCRSENDTPGSAVVSRGQAISRATCLPVDARKMCRKRAIAVDRHHFCVQLSNSGRERRAPMSWESIAASREVWGAPLGGFRSIRDGGESRKGRGGHGKACRVSLGRFWLTRQTAVVDGGVERSGVHPLGGVNDAENAERRAVSHPAVVG